MTRDDVLRLLLASTDDDDRVFDHTEVVTWPPGAIEGFQRLGLLRAAQMGLTAPCPNCDEHHVEHVTVVGRRGKQVRYFIACPESLRVEVTPEMCQGWEVDRDGLARALATALERKESPKAVLADRLWRLGRIPWAGKTREVVLANRMGDIDAASVAAHVGTGGRAIVLVPHVLPDERIWPGMVPAVVALSRVTTLEHDRLSIDGVALADIVVEADRRAEAQSILPTDPEVKKQVVRRQVKAEIKGHLEDDVLIASRIKEGSIRKAAAALTKQLERPISKDKIQRAIGRAGGLKALTESTNTASIVRRVASQRRDKGKKI